MNPSNPAGTRPPPAEPPLLQVRGLRLERGDGAALVDGLDVDLWRGQTLAVVGESGSGKSLTALAACVGRRVTRASTARDCAGSRPRPGVACRAATSA